MSKLESKWCTGCGRKKVLSAFPASGNQCRRCINSREKDRREQKAEDLQHSAIKQLIKASSSPTIDAPHISELAAGVVRHLKGLDEVCRLWAEQIMEACSKKKGSQTALHAFMGLARLIRESTELRGTAPDVNLLSNVDLHKEIMQLGLEVLGMKLPAGVLDEAIKSPLHFRERRIPPDMLKLLGPSDGNGNDQSCGDES
jgi:hypothetical protein